MINVNTIFFDKLKNAKPLDALKEAIQKNDQKIMDLNRQQLDRGLDSEGKSLGKYANFKYKNRYQPIDLLKTGDWRDKFTIQVSDKESEIFSQDPKEKKLTGRFGKDIHGVPKQMIPNMAAIIKEDFIKNYQDELRKS